MTCSKVFERYSGRWLEAMTKRTVVSLSSRAVVGIGSSGGLSGGLFSASA
jgi:hypothetical protein